ncbi:hypothetical protein [Streptomyces iconiensis]|uniref:Uncharacterized protein n=1 Tax=Streptomyces iconiensis TaxID=1384038 RepID=A0ABT6ZRQ4_9ACTN|nr:hypothetical protein [Streptomyces iconiensis]MDJ1131752.1 hypothetical protein [Streptomyces iconiensis]
MIRPQLTADGYAVRLADDRPDVLLDEVAAAYARDPQTVAALLTAHAGAVEAYDDAECDPSATDYGRAMRAAETDATRDALYGELPPSAVLDQVLTPPEAVALADALTARAAHAVLGTSAPRNRKTA